jgi:branched-chain amino acid transport system ATP-binding protein
MDDVPVLKIEDLHVSYGHIKALRGVSIYVNAGEVVTLIGANGAGKTTLLKTISRLLSYEAGDIQFQGSSIRDLRPSKLAGIGITHVPEERFIYQRMSVEENLLIGAYQRKDKAQIRSHMETIFELFPVLRGRLKKPGQTLSGGESTMLAVGRGLMANPSLMLLDEPSLGLAPLLVRKVFQTLAQLKERGITMLLVEQNARKALKLADRGYVISNGRVVVEGESKNLLNDPNVAKAYMVGKVEGQ